MQLEFKCPGCRISGLTPDIREDKAIAVALKQLRIRCPTCSAIVEVTEPLGRVLRKSQEKAADVLVELSSLVREALEAETARRAAKKETAQDSNQKDGTANGSQRICSETNGMSSAAGFRR